MNPNNLPEKIFQDMMDLVNNTTTQWDGEDPNIIYKNFQKTTKILLEDLKQLTNDEKKIWAPKIMAAKKTIDDRYNTYKEKEKFLEGESLYNHPLNLMQTYYQNNYGQIHPLKQTINELYDILNSMGFSLRTSSLMTTEENNFDDLNFPSQHPAREMQDTFFLNNNMILRTHTSTAQIKVLKNSDPFPIKIFSLGQVFRNETIDATHNSMFYQMEIMYINEDANVLSLKGTMEQILKKFFAHDKIEIRFRSSFFPFVVPGFEVDLLFNGQWLEIAGCGMIHPKVMDHNKNYDNNIMGFAAGFGVDRLHMIKHNIKDIRDLYITQKHLYT